MTAPHDPIRHPGAFGEPDRTFGGDPSGGRTEIATNDFGGGHAIDHPSEASVSP